MADLRRAGPALRRSALLPAAARALARAALLVLVAAGAAGLPSFGAHAQGVQGADPENTLVITLGGKAQGRVEVALLPDVAPLHAARLKALARAGAYDGVVFHRVIEGFMAQTGDVRYGRHDGGELALAGRGGSDLPDLPAEFSDIPFERGVVGMARTQDPDSANSQFFIMFGPAPHLNGLYTVVGRVVSGMEAVDGIARGDRRRNGLVAQPDWMESVRVKADVAQ